MIPLRWLVFLGGLGAGGMLLSPAHSQTSPPAAAATAADDRAARIAERYKQMLAANPVEGIALDRLWKSAEERSATAQLLDEYRAASADTQKPTDGRMAAALIYGHLLKRAGQFNDAEAFYKQAADLDAASPLPPLALAELANVRAKPADAAGFYEIALAKLAKGDRRQTDVLLKLGAARLAAGQALAAAQTWERIIALDPNNTALRKQLAENYEKNHLPERAVGHYEYIVGHGSPEERALALRELGRLQQARGNFDAARDALERGLNLTARDNWLHGDLQLRLIRLYQRAGRVPELEARWKAEVEKAPRDLGAYLQLEALAEEQADPAAQRLWLEKIVALAPGDRENALRLARLLADAGEREGAALLYDKLLKVRPNDLDLIFARAEIDLQLNQPKAAVDRVEARMAQSGGDESVNAAALEFFLRRRLDDAAERLLRAEIARQPKAEEPALALAKFFFTQRRPADARAALDATIAQASVADPAARAARLIRAADVYKEQNLNDDALRCWQQATELQPQAIAPLLAASDALVSRGDAAGAAKLIQRAAEAAPDGPERTEIEKKWFQVLQGMSAPINPVEGSRMTVRPRPRAGFPGFGPPTGLSMSTGVRIAIATNKAPLPIAGELGQRMTQWEQAARDQPTVENWLRLARWQSWAHATEAAIESARKAVELNPVNVPAKELLVSLFSESTARDDAEDQLRQIIALDSSRKAAGLKQIANLKQESGDPTGAVAIFEELELVTPGSPDALTDLALALQRAERWYDALPVWERAYALPALTPQQRADIRRPLLQVLERLEQFPRAFDLLFAAVDQQSDLGAKQDLFRELLTFCQKHQMMGELEKRCEERLAAQPQDYFLLTALADFRRASGRGRDAYDLLTQAYYSSPDPAKSLRTLADTAESLDDLDAAIGHQRRLVSMLGQATAENLQRLAALENVNLDAAAAARTWETVIGKFPRDPDALSKAEEFFEKTGRMDRARALLAQITALDAADLKKVLRLGQLSVEAGDGATAKIAFEQVLAHAVEEDPSDSPQPPPAEAGETPADPAPGSRLRAGRAFTAASVWAKYYARPAASATPAADADRQLRLTAIREESRLLFPSPDGDSVTGNKKSPSALTPPQAQWLDRWRKAADAGARNEPLWAFYYAGQKTPLMEHLSRWVTERPENEKVQDAFLVIGLRQNDYARLARWTWEIVPPATFAAPERGDRLIAAMGQVFSAGAEPGEGIVAELFPAGAAIPRETVWSAASNVFAGRQQFSEAIELGNRALDKMVSNRPNYAMEVSHWNLILGRSEAALAVLRSAVEDSAADSLDPAMGNGLFAALREYFLLLPQGKRAAFVQEYLGARHGGGGPAQPVLAGALLHGLLGEEKAACRDLDALLALRMLAGQSSVGSPDERRWSYLLANGSQLEEWNLPNLAIHLWDRAVATSGPFDRQENESRQVLENLRVQLADLRSETAPDPLLARERVDDYLRGQPDAGQAQTLAAQFAAEQPWSAAQVFEYLCRVDPSQVMWRSLVSAYEAAGNRPALEYALRRLVGEGDNPAVGMPPPSADLANASDLIAKLANLMEADGDTPGAQRLLARSWLANPAARNTGIMLAHSFEKAGRKEDAARVWQGLLLGDANATAHLALAILAEERGHAQEAMELLKDGLSSGPRTAESTRVDSVGRLTALYLTVGKSAEARAVVEDLLQSGPLEALPAAAAAYAKAGQAAAAREWLAAGVRRARDAFGRFNLQRALLGYCDDPVLFTREMGRLKEFAAAGPNLRQMFETARFDTARAHKFDDWLEKELKQEWNGGKGSLAAGEKLVTLYLQTGKDAPLRECITACTRRRDVSEQALFNLQESLRKANRMDLAAPVAVQLNGRNPASDVYALACARALWQTQRRDEATTLLDALASTAVFREGIDEAVGTLWLELGERARAAESFGRAVARDPLAMRSPRAALQLGKLELGNKNLPAARRWLRVAYRNPACADLEPLLDYVTAVGQLEEIQKSPGQDFPISRLRRGQLAVAMCARLDAMGKKDIARQLTMAHPELVAAAPELAASLREGVTPGQRTEVAASLENALTQYDPPSRRLARELAAFYVQWAVESLAGGGEAAEAHLVRAHQLRPEDFSVACQLARIHLAKKQFARAAEVLRDFLTPDALPAERDEARRMLGKNADEGSRLKAEG